MFTWVLGLPDPVLVLLPLSLVFALALVLTPDENGEGILAVDMLDSRLLPGWRLISAFGGLKDKKTTLEWKQNMEN